MIKKFVIIAALATLAAVPTAPVASAKMAGGGVTTNSPGTPPRVDAKLRVKPNETVKKGLFCAVKGPHWHGCSKTPWDE